MCVCQFVFFERRDAQLAKSGPPAGDAAAAAAFYVSESISRNTNGSNTRYSPSPKQERATEGLITHLLFLALALAGLSLSELYTCPGCASAARSFLYPSSPAPPSLILHGPHHTKQYSASPPLGLAPPPPNISPPVVYPSTCRPRPSHLGKTGS